jgi:uncharacterized protein (DUF58 family)
MNERTVSLSLLVVVLFATALMTRSGAVALMALPVLTYVGMAALLAPSPEKTRLAAERSLIVTRAGARAEVRVSVSVRNAGEELLPLMISDRAPAAASLTDGSLRQWAALCAGESAELTYAFHSTHGAFQWESVRAVACDALGLFEIPLTLQASGEVLVQPRLRRFRPFPPRPARTLRAPGSILARQGGAGTDFWGVREYHAGDPLRRLDWRRTARRPDQFFTKEMEKEQIADVGLILDARQCNNVWSGGDSLYEHALEATASLAEMFLRGGNRVSLLVAGHAMTVVHAGYGKVQLHRVLRCLARSRPEGKRSDASLDHVPVRTFDGRALVVIVSPLVPSDWQIFPRLRARGNQGLLISPDPISFAGSGPDRATRLATRMAALERRLQLRAVSHLGIRVIDWQVSQPLGPLVRSALRTAERHR